MRNFLTLSLKSRYSKINDRPSEGTLWLVDLANYCQNRKDRWNKENELRQNREEKLSKKV